MFSNDIYHSYQTIEKAVKIANVNDVPNILKKIEKSECLTVEDFASLLKAKNSIYKELIVSAARRIRETNFGKGVGFIVPIYVDTRCKNRCKYCGLASNNKSIERSWLDIDSFEEELNIVIQMGYKTVEIVAGSINYDLNILSQMMEMIREIVPGSAFCLGSLNQKQYEKFVDSNDTMIHFQETYDQDLYKYYHPGKTTKSSFKYRLDALENAIFAGIRKVGIGVLFGLGELDRDVLMLIEHGRYIENRYNFVPKIVGIPRLKTASGISGYSTPYMIRDDDYSFIVAIYRIAFPYSEIVASTRETPEHIQKLLIESATFTNFSCSLTPGGYKSLKDGLHKEGQFHYFSPGYEKMQTLINSAGLTMDFNRYI